MHLRNACLGCWGALFVAACGGAIFSPGGTSEAGASGSSSGSSSPMGGKPSTAGASSLGGATSVSGASSSGMTSAGGGMNCAAVDCAFPSCADGQLPVTPLGQCCPRCPTPALGCADVSCQPVMACPSGYVLTQPPGACCQGCVPESGQVACPKIACAPSTCPLGYVRGDLVEGCCTECVPDASFCNDDSECLMADMPRACCGCPEALNVRRYDSEPCWSDVNRPRMLAKSCYPQATCDVACAACPSLTAVCREHRCSAVVPK